MRAFDDPVSLLVKELIPPLLLRTIRRARWPFKRREFTPWWKTFRTNTSIPAPLVEMVDYFVTTEDFRQLSTKWRLFNRMNIEQIARGGLDNYRQTLARNYLTHVEDGFDDSHARRLVMESRKAAAAIPLNQIFKKHDLFSQDESVQHNLVTALMYDHVIASGLASKLTALDEPGMGNPPAIEIDGKRISQDLLYSVLEFSSVQEGENLAAALSPVVMELGAGSGRTAYCFLKLIPQAKYIIVDVPPALFVSQSFLSAQFPDRTLFPFRPFNSYSQIAKEFEAAEIAFLMPHQLELLGGAFVDVFIAIDCLHEMTRNRVEFYFHQADRLARNIYFKCWLEIEEPTEFDGIKWSVDSYPILAGWEKCYQRPCLLPDQYFEAYFHIRH